VWWRELALFLQQLPFAAHDVECERPVFVIDSLRALVDPGQRSTMPPTLSRQTIFAADYFMDEDAAAMLEYVNRL
jgi:hypothetical protein